LGFSRQLVGGTVSIPLFLTSHQLNHIILCGPNYFSASSPGTRTCNTQKGQSLNPLNGLVEITMQKEKPKKLKIMIIEDEEDILILYKDFISIMGHEIVCASLHANNIMPDFEKNLPDICLIDYKIPGHKSGMDAAIEILTKYPLTPIIFITAYYRFQNEIINNAFFKDKNIRVLIKPVRLTEIEKVILDLVAHKP
jgi:CheY-like chemotaxis protein